MPEPLSTPTLISPTYDEQEVNINVQFKWNPVDYATSYMFQISMDENFSNFVETYYDILDTTIANLNLPYNTEYFWKVRAIRSNDTSDWSSVWKFKTEEGIIVQNISLESGWNLTALGVEPTNNSMASIVTPIATELIQVKNCNGQVYMPPFFNTLNEWNTSSAYKIKMASAMQMPTSGLRIKPEMHPIGFADVGWYWVPYFRTSTMQPATALASLASSFSQIKSISGLVYYPPYLNTLNLLQPNTGYMLRIIQSGILTYPAND